MLKISFSESDRSCRLNSSKAGAAAARFLSTLALMETSSAALSALPRHRASTHILQKLIHPPIWLSYLLGFVPYWRVLIAELCAEGSCGIYSFRSRACLSALFKHTQLRGMREATRARESGKLGHNRPIAGITLNSRPGNLLSIHSRCV